MRYIETEYLIPPAGWLERVRTAQKAIAAVGNLLKTDPVDEIPAILIQLKALVNAQGRLWSVFKKVLEEASNRKCWYCEAKQSRSDMAVDHFRPKNAVKE